MAKQITVRVAVASEYDVILELFREAYYKEEPLTNSHVEPGHTPDDEEFTMSWIKDNTMIIAVDDENGKCVGALSAGPIEHGDADQMIEDAKNAQTKKWREIMLFLAYLEKKADILHRFNLSRALHVHAIGVHSDYRGQQIGERLFKTCFENAKRLSYPMVSADCTSPYSKKIAERLGMQTICIATYEEYNKSVGEVQFKPKEPNFEIKTFAKEIR